MAEENKETVSRHFIEVEIDKDLKEGVYDHVQTRFPPEPNGLLHIGHAKSILLNSGIAKEYDGRFLLRFDDTNPSKEKEEFMEAIIKDVDWLTEGYKEEIRYASDCFQEMYDAAVRLIKRGKAFISTLSAEEMREYRGTLTEPGKNDPDRERPAEESLRMFEEMKSGSVPDGAMTLRAKIDMSSPNINMRDPVIYRVAHIAHPRTGEQWCIYPMYDFAHPIEDAVEGTTHSLCTMEFEDHRPLYDWVIREAAPDAAAGERPWASVPRQIEFAKMYLTNVVTGKRYIKKLVEDKLVDGWDDPRLVTIAALRRRGYTPAALRNFITLSGISKAQSSSDMAMLEYCLREDLKLTTDRVMAVLDPVKLVIDNYPAGQTEMLTVENNKEAPERGTREVSFSGELYIEREDFMEEPPKKYFRLFPGNEVRLMNAYIVTCTSCEKDAEGNVTVVHCSYDPDTKSGMPGADKKVKGTIHWVDAATAVTAPVRVYESLIDEEKGVYNEEDGSVNLNPDSVKLCENAKLEAALGQAKGGDSFQFVRSGYFHADVKDSKEGAPVFHRIVSMKSSFRLPA
ncbi:MAG: glutamine--tRNA ligase/YqeY domain fusion protein [Lachnospiraceae bacterium]|nr:glutamine--tRNA ligase/YqeY domain fusion protein [Lachnospiraceae bacterium]